VAVSILSEYNIPICLMQCNTNYTVDLENHKYINLNVLKTYENFYPNIELGLSDHTAGDITVLGAVALGATMVEKHFTDDNNREGPDHPFSMNPKSWRDVVDRTRLLELSLGDGDKKVEDNEKETVVLQRRSIRINKDLYEGYELCEEDLYEVRPCPENCIPPSKSIVGKKLTCDLQKGDCIKYEHIE